MSFCFCIKNKYTACSDAPSASVTDCQSEWQFWLEDATRKRCVTVAALWISGAAKRHCPVEDRVRDRINSTHDLTYSAVIRVTVIQLYPDPSHSPTRPRQLPSPFRHRSSTICFSVPFVLSHSALCDHLCPLRCVQSFAQYQCDLDLAEKFCTPIFFLVVWQDCLCCLPVMWSGKIKPWLEQWYFNDVPHYTKSIAKPRAVAWVLVKSKTFLCLVPPVLSDIK